MKDIKQVLMLMTVKQREVVKLKLKGFTQDQIAKKLGKTQQAISYLFKAGIERAKNQSNIFSL